MVLQMFIFILLIGIVNSQNCSLEPVVQGVNINQTLGDANRQIFPNSTVCKQKCYSSEFFNCSAIIWNGVDQRGPCYLFDTVNITNGIITDDSKFILYVQVCDNEYVPSVETCTFVATESLIDAATGNISYSASASQAQCENLCLSTENCDNFISENEAGTGACHLYSGRPENLADGAFILYSKKCEDSTKNCIYTSWSDWTTCSSNCTQSRSRTVLEQAEIGGIECTDNELNEDISCTCNTSSVRISRSAKINKSDCNYSTWSEWSSCDNVTCLTTRNRSSETCGSDSDQLPCECSDSSITSLPSSSVSETGCRVENFNLLSRPSSKGIKVLTNSTTSCANACAVEQSFVCEAFSLPTSGNGTCILYGEIDQDIIQTAMTNRYLQDVFCTTKGQGADKLCGYSRTKTSIYPGFSNQSVFLNITLDSNESCESYSLKNLEYLQYESFLTHRMDGLKSDMCILYNSTNNNLTFSNGDLDSYTFSCSTIFRL